MHLVVLLCVVCTGAIRKIIGREGTSERSCCLLIVPVHRFLGCAGFHHLDIRRGGWFMRVGPAEVLGAEPMFEPFSCCSATKP